MPQRVLVIDDNGALDLDGLEMSLEEYEAVLKSDQEVGDDTPIKVRCPFYTDEKSSVGEVFTRLLELADQYRHPVDIMMGTTK
ncbi:MAG: hypothetical protein AAGH57_00985 [Pseudomonadota bacterium]